MTARPRPGLAGAVLAGLVGLVLATPLPGLAGEAVATDAASAQRDEEEPGPGALSVRFDSTIATAYLWRGVLNQRNGIVWQPSLDLALTVFRSADGIVRAVDAGVGTWMSVHDEDAGAFAPGSDGLYETDYSPTLTVAWAGGFSTLFTYYFYTSPADAFPTIEEFAIDLAWDDSDVLGVWALAPTATLSLETRSSSFGTGKGASLELGIEPGTQVVLPFEGAGRYPLAVAFPVRVGLSVDGYYADGSRDETFGYFLAGLHVGVPLPCLPGRLGTLTLTNGFDLYVVNDAIERYTSDEFGVGDPVYPVWTTSLTLER